MVAHQPCTLLTVKSNFLHNHGVWEIAHCVCVCVCKTWMKASMVVVYLVHEEICIESVMIAAWGLCLIIFPVTCP